jgi:hypothetical protein
MEDAMVVGVDGDRHPVGGGDLAEEEQVAGSPEDAVQRGMGEDEIFSLGQEFGEMPVVDADVGGADEADHPIPDDRTDAAGGRGAAIAVDEGLDPAPTVGSPKTPELAHGEADEGRRLGHHHLPALEGIEDHEPLLRRLCQCDHASPVRTGRGGHFH